MTTCCQRARRVDVCSDGPQAEIGIQQEESFGNPKKKDPGGRINDNDVVTFNTAKKKFVSCSVIQKKANVAGAAVEIMLN